MLLGGCACSQGGSVPGGGAWSWWLPALMGVPAPGGCLVEIPWDSYCCGRYVSYWNAFLLPPANIVCEGYVFTGVCLSTGVLPQCMFGDPPASETPLSRDPPTRKTPTRETPPTSETPHQADPPTPGRPPSPCQGYPPGRPLPGRLPPHQGDPLPTRETPSPPGRRPRPTPKEEIEGDEECILVETAVNSLYLQRNKKVGLISIVEWQSNTEAFT